jgi:cytochrome b involved in lipid metabolism
MKKLTGVSLFIFFCVVTAILTAGLVFYQNNKNNSSTGLTNQNKTTDLTNLASAGITILDSKEVAKHNTNANCWIVVNSKVYNISNYASSHPGGVRNITNYCGKESTNAFDTKGGRGNSHSTSANNLLAQYYIGDLNQTINQNTLNQTIQNTQLNPSPRNRGGEENDD